MWRLREKDGVRWPDTILGGQTLFVVHFHFHAFIPSLCSPARAATHRYGHGIFDRRHTPAKGGPRNRAEEGGDREGASGGGIGGNVFWKQWHFPVRTRGRNGVDDEDALGSAGTGDFDPLFDGNGLGGREGARAEAAAAEREFESSDRRPWTDLIPRFRVKVEPLTTLKLRKRFYPFKTVIELGADYNTQVRRWIC